ncbi:DNA primase [Aureliella helgolandensis]|uniref:DNA primase n=1 Tax=Aureliella helgolandensis TaxID=2527968 RepID=A0A518G3D2_9BACT|nr:DNA primase [Aureliella helgolandensis]
MSFAFESDTKERVRAATDIVDLIGSRLELRRQGRNYVALCPWHKDSRPSLQVNTEKQIWKCWVCDIGGDVFTYLMQDQGLSFGDALRQLADRAGIALDQGKSDQRKYAANAERKAALYRTLAWAEEKFHKYLMDSQDGATAREYLKQRGISDESLELFKVGLAPNAWSVLLDSAKKQNLSAEVLEAAGMVIRRDRGGHYDRFRNRIMFPIRDRDKKTIAFGGRVLPGSDEGAKYINSPETRLFQKSQQLYGFDIAATPIRQTRQAVVMEGYTDVIIAHQFGVTNSVAVLGTALGTAHLKLLRHYCDQIVLLLDGDEAGQKRSDDVLELFLHAQMDVRVLTLPDKMDPADFLLKHGTDALKDLLADSVDAMEFKMRRVSTGFDPMVDTHRANQAVEEMLSLLAKVPSSGLISNESFRLRQNQILPRLARRFSIPEDSLRSRLTDLRKKGERLTKRPSQADAAQPTRLLRPGDLSPFERELLELIIVAPQVAPLALERVQSGWLECEAARQMLDAYQTLEFEGQSLEFESVMIALEDSSLKSLLVTLHDQANAKLQYTRDSAENRLQVLTQRMGEQQDVMRRQQLVSELQNNKMSEKAEMDVLQDMIREARLRQGLFDIPSSPEVPPQALDEKEPTNDNSDDVPLSEQSSPG